MDKAFLSKYLLRTEYACHCCGKLPPFFDPEMPSILHEILFDRFDHIRDEWGGPLVVLSGYRCIPHNKAVGGEAFSLHCFGMALDINVHTSEEVMQLVKVAETVDPDLRLGFEQYLREGKTFLHMDIGYLINPRFSLNLHEGARW